MRFCIAIWASMLLLATPVLAGGSEGESCKHDDKHSGEHKCKHKKKKIHFYYGWSITMSDEKLGEEPRDDSKGFIRKISSGYWTGIEFSKKWEEYNLALYYDFSQEKVSDGFITATVNAELPRSYLSVEVGKKQLHFGGFRGHTSPYLSYHSPFSTYAAMGRIYAPLEGFGELSLMVTNDVIHDKEKHGEGETRRWHVDKQTVAPLFQYKGKFDMVSPMLQFAFYDYDGWYRSWAATASLKVKIDKMTMLLDGTWDRRQHPVNDDEYTDYVSMAADLTHRHGMVTMTIEASHFLTIEDSEADKVEGNRMPIKKGEKPKDYDEMKGDKKDNHPYTLAEVYHKGDWMKYGDNMTHVAARLDVHCIEDKFVPYIRWVMKHHKIDDEKFIKHVPEGEDKHIKEQFSHTIAVGIEGKI